MRIEQTRKKRREDDDKRDIAFFSVAFLFIFLPECSSISCYVLLFVSEVITKALDHLETCSMDKCTGVSRGRHI